MPAHRKPARPYDRQFTVRFFTAVLAVLTLLAVLVVIA